ncbi:hypothetical protein [Aureimonas jatrophae]|jgi:hypothetical protein|uniref:Uncharacterized protein n=1 Tax=Aureimonas jatrophae TaxID=1166073 RepID=A0A1H0LRF9_9HYPH|nr:hypothetical protein [Aureimonas jatrophae]MBB3952700.1 hypothetical protein [Aureimonas jatrophae]SDO70631.1 hypothetical protein SAMN05192530_11110 [Aureimonas jatrophae]
MRLVAWTLRLLGCLVLAVGVVLAVGDAARSIAADRLTLLSIDETLAMAMPANPAEAATAGPAASGVFGAASEGAPLSAVLGLQPASVVAGLAGLLLIALGRPQGRGRRSYAPRRSKAE